MREDSSISQNEIFSILGRLNFLQLAKTKRPKHPLIAQLHNAACPQHPRKLTQKQVEALLLCIEEIKKEAAQTISHAMRHRTIMPPLVHIVTDASKTKEKAGLGAAAFFQNENNQEEVHSWMRHSSAREASLDQPDVTIFDLETLTVACALCIFKPKSCVVLARCDNQGSCFAIRDGACRSHLGNAALVAIHRYLEENDVALSIRYIHTKRNPADSLSRLSRFQKIRIPSILETHIHDEPPTDVIRDILDAVGKCAEISDARPGQTIWPKKKKKRTLPLPGQGLERR